MDAELKYTVVLANGTVTSRSSADEAIDAAIGACVASRTTATVYMPDGYEDDGVEVVAKIDSNGNVKTW